MTTTHQYFATRVVGLLVGVGLLAAAPMQVAAQVTQPGDAATLQVMEDEEVGAYLADADGRSLYLFEIDTTQTSACYDECARAWPPLTTDAEPEAGAGVNADMLDTITRRDGTTQVTYNGWPLYYYGQDYQPGDIKGHDIDDHGAEWYLISPDGTKVGEEEAISE